MRLKKILIPLLGILCLASCSTSNNGNGKYHTIVWLNYDNTLLQKDDKVADGQIPIYSGEVPIKEGDDIYNYSFSGWTPEITPAYYDTTYKATFKESKKEYIITFKNDDGSILMEEKYNYGDLPSYKGQIPTKEKNVQYSYTFNGWTPEIEPVTKSTTYYAKYNSSINKYNIVWKNYDGSLIDTEKYEYGETPLFKGNTPIKQSDQQFDYYFSGWDPEIKIVDSDQTYVAQFSNSLKEYTVTWNIEGKKTTEKYKYGETPSYKGETPAKNGNAQYFYNFSGWSPAITQVTGNITYTALFNQGVNSYTITWKNYDGDILKIDTDVLYGSKPSYIGDMPTKPRTDQYSYAFSGWAPSIDIVRGDATYTAQFAQTINTYTITFDANGGSVSPKTQTVKYGDYYTLPIPAYSGYKFSGWYEDQSLFDDGVWTYGESKTLIAHWNKIYSITYNLDGGTISSTNPTTYTIEDSFELIEPVKTGYAFAGWFNENGNKVTSITVGTTGDLIITARWTANLNSLSITSEDTTKGTVIIASGSGYSDESITVVATPIGDCVFKGWYHESSKVSYNATYTFVMPTNDYSLVAHFFTKAEDEEERAQKYATRPFVSDDGKTITYGLYPQTNINDSSLISALNALTTAESNGWYLYDGEYYAKFSATPSSSGYRFDNRTTIVSGTTYWFKCEPIVWNVLSNNNGEYYILSSVLLDAHCYCNSTSSRTIDGQIVYVSNYKYSEIRTWLNEDFYNSAFALGNSHIQTTTVNNSSSTTNSSSNSYGCANTEDKVFLPSYQDYINSSYGFSTSTGSTNTRYCKTTDWARARGAHYDISSSYLYNGWYWTRSPYSGYSDFAWYVYRNGDLRNYYVNDVSISVRPSLSVKIA